MGKDSAIASILFRSIVRDYGFELVLSVIESLNSLRVWQEYHGTLRPVFSVLLIIHSNMPLA